MNTTTLTPNYVPKKTINNISVAEIDPLQRVCAVMISEDLADNSKAVLRSDLKQFFTWYSHQTKEGFSFENCVPSDLTEYKQYLVQHYKPATVNRRLVSLKKFFKTAVVLDIITKDISAKLKFVPREIPQPKGLSKTEERRFMRAVERAEKPRDEFIIGLMLYAGLRVSEVAHLRMSDIELMERKGSVNIRNSKGNKTRRVPLNYKMVELARAYGLENNPDSAEPVFMGNENQPLSIIALSTMVKRYANIAEVKLSAHTLRHTFAYNFLADNPADIIALGQILGHSNIVTTQAYVQNRYEDLESKMGIKPEQHKCVPPADLRF